MDALIVDLPPQREGGSQAVATATAQNWHGYFVAAASAAGGTATATADWRTSSWMRKSAF